MGSYTVFLHKPIFKMGFSFYTPMDFNNQGYKMNKDEKIQLMKLKYAMMAASAYSLFRAEGYTEGSPFDKQEPKKGTNLSKKDNR